MMMTHLQEGEQRLVPHDRHLPRVVREAREVVHKRIYLQHQMTTIRRMYSCVSEMRLLARNWHAQRVRNLRCL